MSGIVSDDKETSRVIAIHDGAREVSYGEALIDVALAIARLARIRAANIQIDDVSNHYAAALGNVLKGIQELQAERRKA